jgi:putative spermidine/putrescine transport system substrate-binding protein
MGRAWLGIVALLAGCAARPREVNFAMWGGDEARNRYFETVVGPHLQARHGLTLRIVPYGHTSEVVSKLITEKAAGKTSGGSVDVVWINGENFRAAKQAGVLWGPIVMPRLYPAAAYEKDFGTPIDGLETPWQSAQFVMAWDTARFAEPPRTLDALVAWVKAHPGRFTYPAPPDFSGSVFTRHFLLAKGFDGGLAALREMKPYLWKRGETYPATIAELDRLFANHEIDFAMSYGPSFASERIARGVFPATVRTFVFDSGTIGNFNYLAVPFNAADRPAALTLIGDLTSRERLLDMARQLGHTFPHAGPDPGLPRGIATLPPALLREKFLPEPDADELVRFEQAWRQRVLLVP